MRVASLSLTLGGLAVALGGLYILWELRTGAGPTPTASAQSARPSSTAPASPSPSAAATPRAKADRTAALPSPRPRAAAEALAGASGELGEAIDKPALPSVDSAERLLEANKLYDRGDYDGARQLATQLLAEAPGNVKLLRVVVSSSCILGDGDTAQKFVGQLPELDRGQMRERCAKFEIALK